MIANLPKTGGISNFFRSQSVSPRQVEAENQKTEGNTQIILEWLCTETIKTVKSSIQIHQECQPQWEGYLIVDDKMINIRGEKKVSLIAKDKSGDVVHEELFSYTEQDKYDDFVRFIKLRLKYPFISITTDLVSMLSKSIKTILAEDIPHQLCLKHTFDNINRMVKYQSLKVKLN